MRICDLHTHSVFSDGTCTPAEIVCAAEAAGISAVALCDHNTVDGLPMYFNWRVFDLTGIRFDNFATKGSSLSVCEVIMSGVFKRPALASAKPYAIRQPKDDGSDLADCDAWIKAAETLPKA